jgi:hypothetical protein
MYFAWITKAGDTLSQLPQVYELMPASDYQRGISHSARELDVKSWNKTNKQMRVAISSFEKKNPHAKRTASIAHRESDAQTA